jgi:hypothetical protein
MNSSPVIFAIAPGTREVGIAVFTEFELTYFSVKTLNSKTDLSVQISELLQYLFQGFAPQIVIIKSISSYQRLSNNLGSVVKQIKFEANRANLRVLEITLEQIKTKLCKNENQTQKKAFQSLLIEYPELKRFWNRPNKWQNDYYSFLFSAVAIGAVFLKTRSKL